MTQSAPDARASASRIAKWMLDKGHPADAVSLLCAWAVSGPNDADGQALLAEALRIDPSAAVARMAFQRMEGIKADHSSLDAAIKRFGASELSRLEGEMKRPSFRRAQVGFNNNVKYREHIYHVQTEDSGLDKPHIITHLFADGGRVIKSHKRLYADAVSRPDVTTHVRALMKGQHMEMVLALREGRFDPVIDGTTMGGMTVLTEPPNVEVRKLAAKKEEGVAATPPPPAEAADASKGPLAPPRVVHFRLHVARSLTGGPDKYEPAGDEVLVGSTGAVTVHGERFCHPREAAFRWRERRLWLEDFRGGNGVFLRIRTPVELELGDEFIVGDQLLRVQKNPIPANGPDAGPTYFYSSPTWISAFRVVQVFEGGAEGACVVARGSTLQIGSVIGDLVLQNDPLVDDQHCLIEEQAGVVVLTDLDSRTGVFVRIRGEQEVVNGDELLIGRTRLIVDIPPPN